MITVLSCLAHSGIGVLSIYTWYRTPHVLEKKVRKNNAPLQVGFQYVIALFECASRQKW